MKRGNCSKDTIADRAIASPNSFPKCSEGKLGEDRQRFREVYSPLASSRII